MKHLFFCLPFLFLLSSCIEEENDFIPPSEPISTSHDLFVSLSAFTDEEFDMLSDHLDISQIIDHPIEPVPDHIQRTAGGTFVFNNQEAKVKALFGRMLFYDTSLSATGETSCASCHKAELGFGDDLAFSKGISGQVTERNSIALASVPSFVTNISGYGSSSGPSGFGLFWDGRARNIQSQCRETIANPIEMGRNVNTLAAEIRDNPVYAPIIRRLLQPTGSSFFNSTHLTRSLETFCKTITSMNTPIDDFKNRQIREENYGPALISAFGEEVVAGAVLFDTNCAVCHGESFAKPSIDKANNGLALEYSDKGFGATFSASAMNGVFKVPFLRNIEVTGPYMHDGSIATLREVIDHYSEGIQDHPQLHEILRDEQGRAKKMNFTEAEKDALIAYLKLATDETLTEREYLQNPWRE